MGWWSKFWYGTETPGTETPGDDRFWDEFDDMRRRQDPDYDERQRVHQENVELRKKRDLLAQQQENARLRQEIAELESNRRCGCGAYGDHDESHEQ
jgi:hypothetical protein